MILLILFFFILLFIFCFKFLISDKIRKLKPDGKCILITGCDSGIGLVTAEFCSKLHFVVIAGCLNLQSDGAKKLLDLKSSSGLKVHVLQLDITKKDSIEETKDKVEEILKQEKQEGLWSLVNNAGICVFGEFDWLTESQIQNQIQVNLIGTISVTKSFLPLVKKAQGRIITMGSINGVCSYPGLSIYCATKFALEGFTQVLRDEMRKFKVQVILIRPGDFAKLTNIMSNHFEMKNQMWNEMKDEDKKFYKSYFEAYHDHILNNYGMTSPANYSESTIFDDIKNSLLDKNPRLELTVASISFQTFFKILTWLPLNLKSNIIDILYKHVFKFDSSKYLKM